MQSLFIGEKQTSHILIKLPMKVWIYNYMIQSHPISSLFGMKTHGSYVPVRVLNPLLFLNTAMWFCLLSKFCITERFLHFKIFLSAMAFLFYHITCFRICNGNAKSTMKRSHACENFMYLNCYKWKELNDYLLQRNGKNYNISVEKSIKWFVTIVRNYLNYSICIS